MKRNKRVSKGKEIRPTFFVFCEGETEEQYVCFLRGKYRLPVMVKSKIIGNRITEKYINNYKKDKQTHPKDKNFLLYDLDAPGIFDRLSGISNSILLVSNPCIEFWFLLHVKEQRGEINTVDCLNALKKHQRDYQKSILCADLLEKLTTGQTKATHRAKTLNSPSNPSTTVFRLIEELEAVKALE
ncbi:RloB family protein [Cytophagales bacterium LB-30]|uniref:RloB family protein n=1 Tax=Shiella aurantiaca TaxID=3058365 RepID=A0ABT8F980_9BACT|nr:RloB family protein [Shiella aurantiaca]MDN4167038.1 RloB family protein [Shiella aurantiaca]